MQCMDLLDILRLLEQREEARIWSLECLQGRLLMFLQTPFRTTLKQLKIPQLPEPQHRHLCSKTTPHQPK